MTFLAQVDWFNKVTRADLVFVKQGYLNKEKLVDWTKGWFEGWFEG